MTSFWWRHMLVNNHNIWRPQVCAGVLTSDDNKSKTSDDVIICDLILSKIFLFAIVTVIHKENFYTNTIQFTWFCKILIVQVMM